MATANFDENPPPSDAPRGISRGIQRPADYYSSPPGPRLFPPWVTYGCGGAAVLVMLLVFGAGIFLSGGGFAKFLDLALGMTLGEMRGMYEPSVTQAQKDAMEKEFETMRQGLRDQKVQVAKVQPVMQAMSRVTSDEKLTAAEVDELTAAVRTANAQAGR